MKKNTVALLVVVVLLATSIWVYFKQRPVTFSNEGRNFAVEDTSSIDQIILADLNKHRIELIKKGVGDWELNGHLKARKDAIDLLLATIQKVTVKNRVGKNAQNTVIAGLASKATKVEIYSNKKCIKAYYVGSPAQDTLGTYMLLTDPATGQNAKEPFVTYIPGFEGFLSPRYFTSEKEWKNRVVFSLIPPQIKSIRLENKEQENTGFVINHTANRQFELIDLKGNQNLAHVDTLAVMQYLSYFQNIQFEAEEDLPQRVIDSVLNAAPFGILTLIEKTGQKHELRLFHKKPAEGAIESDGKPAKYDVDRFFAEINNDHHLLTMQFFVMGKLLQPVGYFTPKSLVKK